MSLIIRWALILLNISIMPLEKIKIALLTNNDDDVYCFRKELIEGLIAEGYEMLISCPDGPKFELMKDISYIYDNPDIDRRGTNPVKDFELMRHYHKLFKQYRPSVVLTYTAKPNVYASLVASQLGIPVINNLTGLGSVVNERGLKKAFIMWLFKLAYKKSACMMFQNETNMKVAINAGMVKGRYRLIPGSGVAIDRYPLQPYPEGGDGKIGAPVVFNYMGRVMYDKRVDDYIEAAKRIKANYPQTEFNLLGFIEPTESHYEQELKDLEKTGVVIYRGSQKDVRPYVARAHATIHPSTYGEGMSNVLLESASSGRFLITTDNPGCKETVEDGKTGFIYHGGNVDELVSCIERFLALSNKQRKTAGEFGRQRMEKQFSRQIVIDAYKEEISRLSK